MAPLAKDDSSWFLSLLRPPWVVDLQAGEPCGHQLLAEVPGVDGAAAGAQGMEPGPAHLPLLPAARAARPKLQEQPWRQVDMPVPHPPHPKLSFPTFPARVAGVPAGRVGRSPKEKERGDWLALQRQEKQGGLRAHLL